MVANKTYTLMLPEIYSGDVYNVFRYRAMERSSW